MALSDEDIKKWSERGDPIHAWFSYEMVRESLTPSRLNGMSCTVYPQGSYANKTNIATDSDVDMVIALRSAFYPEKSELSALELEEYAKYYEQADRTWRDFRKAVIKVLHSDFFLKEGRKAIQVRSGLIRLPADVLVALDYRHYRRFPSFAGQSFVEGVQFYTPDDQKIVNYPKRHIRACAQKDLRTNGKYREVVRVAKNARNALIAGEKSPIEPGTAPSYFLESLLWNVPDPCYRGELENAYRRVIGWLDGHPSWDMHLPNGRGGLFGHTADTSWSRSGAESVVAALHSQLTP
jgi:hypothetical protein